MPDSFTPSQLVTLLPTSLTEAIKREVLQVLNTSSTQSLGLGHIFTLPLAAWVNPLAHLAATPPLIYQIPCLSSAQGLHSISFSLYCLIPLRYNFLHLKNKNIKQKPKPKLKWKYPLWPHISLPFNPFLYIAKIWKRLYFLPSLVPLSLEYISIRLLSPPFYPNCFCQGHLWFSHC